MVQTRLSTSVLLSAYQLLEGLPGPLEPEQKDFDVREKQAKQRQKGPNGYQLLNQEMGVTTKVTKGPQTCPLLTL